jgi:hypothetical protein
LFSITPYYQEWKIGLALELRRSNGRSSTHSSSSATPTGHEPPDAARPTGAFDKAEGIA